VTVVDEQVEETSTRRPPWWLAPARWWRELLIIGVVYGLYTVIQRHINVSPVPAMRNSTGILDLERQLGIAIEPSLNHFLVGYPWLAVAANCWYILMHEIATPAVIFWIFRWHRDRYPYARFMLAVPTLIGFTLFYVVPVAPPRLLPASGEVDTLSRFASPGSYGDGAMAHTAAQFAAFPSLHIAWSLWCGAMICWLVRRWYVRVLAVCYPCTTALVVLVTGNHYIVDIIGGITVFVFGVSLLWLFRPADEVFVRAEPVTESS